MNCKFMTSNLECNFKIFDKSKYIFRCSCMGTCPYEDEILIEQLKKEFRNG